MAPSRCGRTSRIPSAEAFAGIQAAQAPPKLAFLTTGQYATLDAFSEPSFPPTTVTRRPRRRVADYIDLLLSESDDQTQRTWTAGLALLEADSRRRFKLAFAQLSPAQVEQLLTDISRNEASRGRRSSSSSR